MAPQQALLLKHLWPTLYYNHFLNYYMNKPIIISIFLCISLLLTACSKQVEQPTSGEKAAIELQRVIKEKNILRVYPVRYDDIFPNFFPANTGTKWTFSNGFININYGLLDTYNLTFLRKYFIHSVALDNNTSATALILYF